MSRWVERIGLQVSDEVFCGHDAILMMEALRAVNANNAAPSERSKNPSITEQIDIARMVECELGVDALWRLSGSLRLESFGDAGLAVTHASTLKEAIATACNFAPLLNIKHRINVLYRRGNTTFEFAPIVRLKPEDSRILRIMDVAKFSSFVVQLAPRLTDTDFILKSGKPEKAMIPGEEIFGVPISADDFDAPLQSRSTTLHGSHYAAATAQMKCIEQRQFIEGVRRLIKANLDEAVTLESAASHFGMTTRTFRRRLKEKSSSFGQIVSELRCSVACEYLSNTEITVTSIAERVGYSESANFRHAFRRWTGRSPNSYRMAFSPQC